MSALGFDPSSVGLKDMLSLKNKKFYPVFSNYKSLQQREKNESHEDEQLFAFLLAADRGIEGDLITLFKETLYPEAKAREQELRETYFRVHEQRNIPTSLWRKIRPILEEEMGR